MPELGTTDAKAPPPPFLSSAGPSPASNTAPRKAGLTCVFAQASTSASSAVNPLNASVESCLSVW